MCNTNLVYVTTVIQNFGTIYIYICIYFVSHQGAAGRSTREWAPHNFSNLLPLWLHLALEISTEPEWIICDYVHVDLKCLTSGIWWLIPCELFQVSCLEMSIYFLLHNWPAFSLGPSACLVEWTLNLLTSTVYYCWVWVTCGREDYVPHHQASLQWRKQILR